MKKTGSMLILLAALFTAACATAAPQPAFKFQVDKVSDRIYAIHPAKYWRVNSTSAVYVGKKGLILVDGQTDGHMAGQMLDTIRRSISPLPVEYVLITHPHFDHTAGLAEIRRRHPGAKVVAHQGMVPFVKEHNDQERTNQLDGWVVPLLNAKKAEPPTPESRAAVEQLSSYVADVRAVKFALPDIAFDRSLTLRFEDRRIELRHVEQAHTPADAVIYFEDEKVLLTGDLFHNLEPLFWPEASPEGWLRVLDHIIAIDAKIYIGGHGDPITDKEMLRFWRRYIEELIALVKAAKASGETLAALQARIDVKDIRAFQGNTYSRRIDESSLALMAFSDGMEAKLDRELAGLWTHY